MSLLPEGSLRLWKKMQLTPTSLSDSPLVVSMRGAARSGRFFIDVEADYIFRSLLRLLFLSVFADTFETNARGEKKPGSIFRTKIL